MIPGDPIKIMLGIRAKPEQIEELRKQLNLDKPIVIQYILWLKNILRGDFGLSIRSKEPVLELILKKLPATIILSTAALFFSSILSIFLGIIAGYKRNSKFDISVMVFAALCVSIPEFWLGIMLILFFASYLSLLPSMGYESFLINPIMSIKHLILPALSAGFVLTGHTTRMTRSQMIDVLNQDYIKTARAKGLKEQVVILRHALKNALIPVVTVIGMQFGYLLGGTVIVEQIFAWPGIGRLVLQSISNRDYPVVQGVVLITAFLFVLINLLVDIFYRFLDPKIRLE